MMVRDSSSNWVSDLVRDSVSDSIKDLVSNSVRDSARDLVSELVAVWTLFLWDKQKLLLMLYVCSFTGSKLRTSWSAPATCSVNSFVPGPQKAGPSRSGKVCFTLNSEHTHEIVLGT